MSVWHVPGGEPLRHGWAAVRLSASARRIYLSIVAQQLEQEKTHRADDGVQRERGEHTGCADVRRITHD